GRWPPRARHAAPRSRRGSQRQRRAASCRRRRDRRAQARLGDLRSRSRRRRGEVMSGKEPVRCPWVGITHPEYARYHDEEWGVPKTDDRALFEKLVLEGFQSGLSWLIILRKRENFRHAFDNFDAGRIARYRAKDVARLMADEGIVRNKLKIEATIDNARA